MREVSGTTWTFQLIILFILIFACFLTLVLNYSKAYRVKNEVISILEKYEGATPESLEIINNYLYDSAYKNKGRCPEGWYGVDNYEGLAEQALNNKNYYYCFEENSRSGRIYYEIRLFYRFSLPVLGELATFKVNGRTKAFIGSSSRL